MSSEALHCVVPERREGRIGVESDQAEPASNNKLSVNWKVLAGLLISGVSLYIAVRSLEPTRVWEAFRAAQYRWIVPAVFLYLFALVARTARWRALLKAERCIPLRDLLPTMAMGRGANNIYPFRTGEIVRVLLLNRRHSVSVAGGFAAILVERIFDGLTMILFLLLAALIGGIPSYLRYVVWAASGIFGVAIASVCAVVVWPSVVQQIADWFIDHLVPQRFWAQIKHIVERFIAGLSSIRSIGTLILVLLFSVSVWTAETISYRLLMNSFGFSVDVHQLLMMSGAANLGTALPSGPANVGTFDAPAIEVLSRIGIPRNTAISYQVLLHAVLWCTETFVGFWFMWRTGLAQADLKRALPKAVTE